MPVTPAAHSGLWRNRDFILLISGQVVSFLGSQVQVFAMPLLVLAISKSATEAGLVLGLSTLSWLVFGIFAGALVDRWNRKTTMIFCDTGRALVTASVPVALWLHALSVAQLCAVAVLNGLLQTLFESANSASLPNVVGVEQLPTALGWFGTVSNTVRVGGSLVAGALYAVGRAVPFLVDAASYLVSVISLRFTHADFQEERTEQPGNVLSEIGQGLRWLRREPLVLFLTLISAGDSIRYGAGYLVIITLAQRVGASPAEIGFIFTGAAIGAAAGSLVSGKANARFPLGHVAIITLWVEALVFPLYAVAPNIWFLGLVTAAESVLGPVYSVAISSYRLANTTDALRGKVFSATQTLNMSALSLGAILGGLLISQFGARTSALIFGGWLFILAVLTMANRHVRRPEIVPDPSARADAAAAQSS